MSAVNNPIVVPMSVESDAVTVGLGVASDAETVELENSSEIRPTQGLYNIYVEGDTLYIERINNADN